MNLLEKQTVFLAKKIKQKKFSRVELVLAPSFPYLNAVKKQILKTKIKLAAQNVAAWEVGAHTGEVSATMLKELGCDYAIVGHSERRVELAESGHLINLKISQLVQKNLTPIFCVGETAEDKKTGQKNQVLVQQIKTSLSKISGLEKVDLIVAYEPVWAIGSGQAVTIVDLEESYRVIKHAFSMLISEKYFEEHVRFIYGGSVDLGNIGEFSRISYLHGFLVGGASLQAETFFKLAECLQFPERA
jgi:triosephosphate isomerase